MKTRMLVKTRMLAAVSALLLAVIGIAALAGCGGGVPQGAIASVGDEVVTQKQFDKIIDQSKAQSEQEGQPEFPAVGSAEYNQFAARVVEYLVQQSVINQAAANPDQLKTALEQTLGIDSEELDARLGKDAAKYDRPIKITQKQIDKQVDQLVEAYGGKESVEELLKQQGMTWKDLDAAIEDQLTGQAVYDRVVAAVKVTDKQIQSYYDKNKDQYDQPETRAIRHILVKTEADAEKVRALLVADPSNANWKKVAKEYSIDPGSKDNGGDLGDVTPGMMVPSFDKESFSIKTKTISKPVKSQFGWHVIEVTKITPAKEGTLEDVKEEIQQTLLSEKQQEVWDGWLKNAQKNADVQYADGFDPKQLAKAEPTASPSAEESPADDEVPVDEETPAGDETPEPSPTAGE
jgi:parvulin-like peptidyl-prolyl isomerase